MGPLKKFFQAGIRQLGSTAPAAWLMARVGHRLDHLSMRTTGRSLLGSLTGLPIIILTSKGAKSGLPRRQPLMAVRDPQQEKKFAVVASNWGQGSRPAWYYNLKAHPQVDVTENGQSLPYTAREVSGSEYDHYWQLATQKYPGYQNYKQRLNGRHIPIMILSPMLGQNDGQGEAPQSHDE